MQIPGGAIMPDSSRIAALEKRVSALEAVVEKFTAHNNARDAITAAEKLCKIYFDIAASCIGEDEVRSRVAAATNPQQRHAAGAKTKPCPNPDCRDGQVWSPSGNMWPCPDCSR